MSSADLCRSCVRVSGYDVEHKHIASEQETQLMRHCLQLHSKEVKSTHCKLQCQLRRETERVKCGLRLLFLEHILLHMPLLFLCWLGCGIGCATVDTTPIVTIRRSHRIVLTWQTRRGTKSMARMAMSGVHGPWPLALATELVAADDHGCGYVTPASQQHPCSCASFISMAPSDIAFGATLRRTAGSS